MPPLLVLLGIALFVIWMLVIALHVRDDTPRATFRQPSAPPPSSVAILHLGERSE